MGTFLVFTLAAPIASFGTLAVGERRPTWDRPSKSQTIGLIAAALGIERADEPRQQMLAHAFGFAVRIDDPGQLLTDFHTTQRASGPSMRRRIRQGGTVDTRRDELDCDELETGLSRRELRQDVVCSIAIWLRPEATVTLETVAQALRAPGFVLYAGRKANALSYPCGPQIVEAGDVVTAFAAFDALDGWRRQFRDSWTPKWLVDQRARRSRPIYSDDDGVGMQPIDRSEERRDMPDSRAKWRFLRRTEVLLRAPSASLKSEAPAS